MKKILITSLLVVIFIGLLLSCDEPNINQVSSSSKAVNENKINISEESLPVSKTLLSDLTPDQFLKLKNLDVQFGPKKFTVNVPLDWTVKTGDYPVGLYWRLANVFSEDVGLSLIPQKGSPVEVWQYALRDGLADRDQKSEFHYPTNVNLLVKSEKVVGAWLSFNTQIGPSVNKRYLDDITGLSFEQWSDREGIFITDSSNNELTEMSPTEVLTAFFNAIDNMNTYRANACLDRQRMLEMLTVNLGSDQLYNPGFGENNSLVTNIVSATPIAFKLIDHESREELQSITNLTEVVIEVSLKIHWKNDAFNNPDGHETRYAYMKKYANGWKIGGLGTGP
ncbi:DUF4830 domain-containing protein [Paenibacillus sp. N3.4]|uniref:DUF4830 domain-containing protein n=1 Tax=Paenibacillus sp. N3.4 TaxID=2603222 RepID=UPI001650AB08|nr:DUF4830 domain-containing protein [Paenibacillus sp. N3.4]